LECSLLALWPQEIKNVKELQDLDRRIAARTKELAMATADNTRCLNTISDLTRLQMNTDKMLTTSQARILADQESNTRTEIAQREQLVQLVNRQAKQIEDLKAKVLKLRRKDTNVYS